MPPWISETIKTAVIPNESSRIESLKIEGIIVKYSSGFRIGCEQDLKAAVK
jgi:hypothetical protein